MTNSKLFSRLVSWGLLSLAALVLVLRVPGVMETPRFWAEEGTLYFTAAYNQPWYRALFLSHNGYYSLIPNMATVAATLVPLEFAPYVTMISSLLIQLIPVALIAFGTSELWKSLLSRVIGVGAVLFTSLNGEVWLNTPNSQFHLSLSAFLILLEDSESLQPLRKWIYRMVLAAAGLTGVPSGFLAPLFFIKSWQDKTKEAGIQGGILLASLLLQMSIIFSTSDAGGIGDRWDGLIGIPTAVYSLVLKSILVPIMGAEITQQIAGRFGSIYGDPDLSWIVVIGTLFGLALLGMFYLVWRYRSGWKFAGGYALLVIPSLLFSPGDKSLFIDVYFAERYFYAPNVILVLALILHMTGEGRRAKWQSKIVSIVLITSVLINGILDYRETAYFEEDWPNWREEVAHWREDPTYEPRIWPGWSAAWRVKLDR